MPDPIPFATPHPLVVRHRCPHLRTITAPSGSLLMRMDKLTSRFQQALADAQSLAVGPDRTTLTSIGPAPTL